MASRSRTERGWWRVLLPVVAALVAVITTTLAVSSHHYMDTVVFGLVAVAMSGVGIHNARALHEVALTASGEHVDGGRVS